MTCIVAIIEDGDIYMGADSAGTDDNSSLQIRKDPKVFKNGEFILGCCGSFRMMQLLRFSFTPPKRTTNDVFKYMCTTFINAVRKCLKRGGLTQVKDNVEEAKDSSFIVGYEGRLFIVDVDFQVGELHADYAATGCGEDIAYGSLYTSEQNTENQAYRLEIALEAAEEFSSGVRSPFIIEVLEGKK